jgi:hypothetical protein
MGVILGNCEHIKTCWNDDYLQQESYGDRDCLVPILTCSLRVRALEEVRVGSAGALRLANTWLRPG